MEEEIKEYFEILQRICEDTDASLKTSYLQLRELLEHLCRMQMSDSSLQMTDLSARISFVASKTGLSVTEQNKLHTFRLTSNAILNHEIRAERDSLLRDVKTLAFFIKRLTGENVPESLYSLLPHGDTTYLSVPFAKERISRLRVCFQYADDTYLYVLPVDSVRSELIKVRYNVPQVNDEFNSTCRLLWPHAQVNLLDVIVDDNRILTPAFIILEPDYLIDISSLAECFKEYGHHPANYMLARLQSSENTRPLLLGNIANLFLDEWIHAKKVPDYLACMKKAFRSYTLELAACPDLVDSEKERQFFSDCRRHFDNLKKIVTEAFLDPGYGLDKADAVLEPSYICESLGLQGRLDYMQRDMSAFIEMKSGKADEYSIRGKIEPKENNRVQMLLYQAVLQYSMGKDHRKVKAYLLYTRYPLLYPARSSWAMVRRIMDVRNRIVANEYGIQLHNNVSYTAERFNDIRPDTLNERRLNNVLWNRYLAPFIDAVSRQIQGLSPLERSYFYTLYNFITKELYTSKSGDGEQEGRCGAASLWLSTLEEKLEAGEILYQLRIRENHAADAHKPYLTLLRSDAMLEKNERDETNLSWSLPNFRQGDAVVLYERNRDTDNVTNRIVFKGNIESISEREVRIRLRASQRNAGVLPSDSHYAIEHDYMDTTFRSMYLGLSAFLSASPKRRALLLGQRMPAFDNSFDEAIAVAPDDFLRVVLKAKAAEDLFLLIGPPGTGKTSHALRAMVEAFYSEKKQILLLSYTNRAVDEICKTLIAIRPEVDFIRMGSELSCEEAFRPYLMENVLEKYSTRAEVRKRIQDCRIFIGTVATLSARTELLRLKQFDVAIVDEATQILEPQLLGLFCACSTAGKDAIGKFILIGDHKQLPAVVLQASEQAEVHDEALRSIGLLNLKDSLFERFYRNLVWQHALNNNFSSFVNGHSFDMLFRQGRMNTEVASFPNEAFYSGLLQPVGLPHQSGELSLSPQLTNTEFADILVRRVTFLPSVPEYSGHSMKINRMEARLAARLAKSVYLQYASFSDFNPNRTLGIITPYRSQIALIRRELASLDIDMLEGISVDTVERFQGSERDVIIYSFCLNRVYQLRHLPNVMEENGTVIDRKLNVVMTRARKQIFIIGAPELLALNPIYTRLLAFSSVPLS